MVETSSTRDAFARRGAPGADRIGSGADHFRRAADKATGDHFRSGGGSTFDPVRPKQDAFAKKASGSRPDSRKPDALKASGETKVAHAKSAAAATAAFAPATPERVAKRAELRVVPAKAQAEAATAAKAQPSHKAPVDDLMFGQGETVGADRVEPEARQRPAAKSSSLVLVAGGGIATAASVDTLDKPAPVQPPTPKAETPAPPLTTPEPPRSGGGGGGSGGGSGAVRARRGFNQDDIAGIALGVVILALLLLWLLRGKDGNEAIAGDDPMLSTQFAATDTGPPETFTPLVDPFGDGVVDLKPKGPMPQAPAEAAPPPPDAPAAGAAETAQLEAAPAPAVVAPIPAPARPPAPAAVTAPPPVAAAKPTPATLPALTSHAWFCTGSAELTDGARAELLGSIAAFRPHAGEPLIVHAFADTRGTSVYNLALSGARARVVADFLRANGLVVTEFEGKGELSGLADGRDCANQRRADIFFKAGSEYRPSAACVLPEEKSAAICS